MTEHEHHGPSNSNYLMVFVSLLTLTAVTVALSYTSLAAGTKEILALLIAATKAILVGTIFMHLKYESKTILVFVLSPLILTAVFLLAIAPDVGVAG